MRQSFKALTVAMVIDIPKQFSNALFLFCFLKKEALRWLHQNEQEM